MQLRPPECLMNGWVSAVLTANHYRSGDDSSARQPMVTQRHFCSEVALRNEAKEPQLKLALRIVLSYPMKSAFMRKAPACDLRTCRSPIAVEFRYICL